MARRYKAYPEHKDSGIEWLQDIPTHWNTIPLKRCYHRVKRTGFETEELLSVYREYGVVPKASRDDNHNQASDDLSPYQLVCEDNLVMNKMKAWQGSIAISEYRGIVSPAYFVYEPFKYIESIVYPKYVHYLLRHPIYINQYMSRSKGIRVGQWDLDPESFQNIELLLPSKEEQRIIIDFLDQEITKIDILIAKQERLIELLKEKRQAVISHVVTKGLNPNVPMKDSGVEWLGDVPEHWEIKPAFVTFEPTIKKNSDGKETNVLSLSYGQIVKRNVDTNFGLLPESFNTYQVINIGDLVLRLTDLQNDKKSLRVGLAKQNGIITSAYLKLKCKPIINACFAYYLLQSYDIAKVFYGMGGGLRQSMKFEELRRLSVLLPEMKEQHNIVNFLSQKTGKFDSLIEVSIQKIELMKERKIALISAAVTGKIDVRDWQGEA